MGMMKHSSLHKKRGSTEGHNPTFSACSLMSALLLPDDLDSEPFSLLYRPACLVATNCDFKLARGL